MCMVLGLAIGGMPVSSIGFGYSWDACELCRFGHRIDSYELVALHFSWVT
jgi:hypothetical protein